MGNTSLLERRAFFKALAAAALAAAVPLPEGLAAAAPKLISVKWKFVEVFTVEFNDMWEVVGPWPPSLLAHGAGVEPAVDPINNRARLPLPPPV